LTPILAAPRANTYILVTSVPSNRNIFLLQ
jgi:hypothetical protein